MIIIIIRIIFWKEFHTSIPTLLIIVSLANLVQVNLYSVETGKKEHELDTKGSTHHFYNRPTVVF